ncbi:MAG: EamA family transporter [bacterium]|nr:EamA family transporter [bacterium]
MSVFFALAAAACFSALAITVTRGFRTNSLMTGLLVSLPVGALVTGAFTLINPPTDLTLRAILFFLAGGIVGEGVGRTSFIFGVRLIGPSTATPLQTATYPTLALLGGWILFSEPVTWERILGALAIVGGISVLVKGQPDSGSSAAGHHTRVGKWAYLLPVLGGLSFAASDLLRKLGLEETPHPAFGAVSGTVTILILWAIILALTPRLRATVTLEPGWQWFIPTGLLAGFGVLAVFAALEAGEVSVVGPIIMSQPLMVVAFSVAFLRDLEKVTGQVAAGALLTVVGVVTLSFSSAG